MTKVSVIIVNYNSGDRLKRCLDHLHTQSFQDFETLVVDNASSDDSITFAQKSALNWQLIEAGSNLGFAAGNNLGVKAAKGEWLAFLNPDAYARADWLFQLLQGAARYPAADAFGSTQIDADDPLRLDGAGDVLHVLGLAYRGHFGWPLSALPADGECFAPCAAAAMYRRETFSNLGGFDERYFCYNEDVDLGFRLRLAGGRCVQLVDAIVDHEGSGVTGRMSNFTVYHGHRNRIWMVYKNMPGLLYWPLMPLRLGFDLLMFGRSVLNGTAGAYWRGMRDGYGGLAGLSSARREQSLRRVVSARDIARALCWSPVKFARRAVKLRKIEAVGAGEAGESREI